MAEKIDDLRRYVWDNLIEIYMQQILGQDEIISELNEAVRNDSQQVNEILNTLSPNDGTYIKDYLLKRLELENEKIGYIFEKGIEIGYVLAKDPISIVLSNKNTHQFE